MAVFFQGKELLPGSIVVDPLNPETTVPKNRKSVFVYRKSHEHWVDVRFDNGLWTECQSGVALHESDIYAWQDWKILRQARNGNDIVGR